MTKKLRSLFTSSYSLYRSSGKIKEYIVRSKLHPVERSVGCQGYGDSRYQVSENIKVTDRFTSFTTKNTHKINHSFDCNCKCQIYLFNRKKYCLQYTAITADHFRNRWSNCKFQAKKAGIGNIEKIISKRS